MFFNQVITSSIEKDGQFLLVHTGIIKDEIDEREREMDRDRERERKRKRRRWFSNRPFFLNFYCFNSLKHIFLLL